MTLTIQTFLNQVVTILGGLAIAYLTLYIAKAKAKITSEVNKLDNDNAKTLLNTAIARIDDLVVRGVNSAEQTLILDIKKQIALGTATKQDLLDVGKSVSDAVYSQLSADTLATLNLEMNDVQKFITATVESQILALKGSTIATQAIATSSVVSDVVSIISSLPGVTKVVPSEGDIATKKTPEHSVDETLADSNVITSQEDITSHTLSEDPIKDENTITNATDYIENADIDKEVISDSVQASDTALEEDKADASVITPVENEAVTENVAKDGSVVEEIKTTPEINLGVLPENGTIAEKTPEEIQAETISQIQLLLSTLPTK
ncbi:hypothetical protein [Clostridium estertheticum]|uniref:hypothetical protein n=1 Tax=Clostridium estertheticum TaxID=238834 RepID=UPI001C0DA605|nr:hypothetical protein [Clostridium estertheticum]MBU3186670.1 hypothetical protein [Clostridium estertheticum]